MWDCRKKHPKTGDGNNIRRKGLETRAQNLESTSQKK